MFYDDCPFNPREDEDEPQIHGLFREDELSDDDVKELKKQIGHIIEYADRKTENSSEKPNNCETCRFELYCPEMCEGCCEWDSHYEPKDEPQTTSMPYKVDTSTICKIEPQTERSE